MNHIGTHCFVSGRVQGVWFRSKTKKVARKLELTGWVRNIDDGRVEVMAFGPESEIKQLESWLQQGPLGARVDDLSVESVDWEDHPAFVVR